MSLTQQQQQHLDRVKAQVSCLMDEKYRAGVREHGGNLWEKDTLTLVDEAIAESIDKLAYLLTARDKLVMNCCVRNTPVSTLHGQDGPVDGKAHDCGSEDPCRACRENEQGNGDAK